MTRFHGEVGYRETTETPPDSGTWVDIITEFPYTGNVIRNTRTLEQSNKVNKDLSLGNSISIVADEHAIKHFQEMVYVRWEGALWTIDSVEVLRPRLILSIGSVYNGPVAPLPEPEE